jgi:uncharacterized protein YciI
MLFVARFTDKPDIAKRRGELLQEHFDWLAANSDRVLLAGSLRTDVGGASLGGLWIIEAKSKADAESVFQTDPFWVHGLRAGVEVFHYVKAHPEKTSVIRDTPA